MEITPRAADQVRRIMKEQGMDGAALRVGVKPSGCSGLEYVIDFARTPQPDDTTYEIQGLKVVVDPNSAAYLEEIRMDWGDGLLGSGFKFTNPNASKTCGCGKSFSV